jgi:hypothetical protein
VTASGFCTPDLMSGMAETILSIIIAIWPLLDVGRGERRALVRHVLHLHPAIRVEEFAREMNDRAVPLDAKLSCPGFAFASAISSRGELTPDRGADHQHAGSICDQADRREILLRVVRQLLKRRSDRMRVVVAIRMV